MAVAEEVEALLAIPMKELQDLAELAEVVKEEFKSSQHKVQPLALMGSAAAEEVERATYQLPLEKPLLASLAAVVS